MKNLTVSELYYSCENISANTVFCLFREGEQLVNTQFTGLLDYYKTASVKRFKMLQMKAEDGDIKVGLILVDVR